MKTQAPLRAGVPAASNKRPVAFEARWNHLQRLWKNALSLESFPQLDRWISEEFKKNAQFGSKDRKWYSEMLFASVRFGYLALFLETSAAVPRADRSLAALRARFSAAFSHPEDILAGWRSIDPVRYFDWVRRIYARTHPGAAEDVAPAPNAFAGAQEDFEELMGALEASDDSEDALLRVGIPMWFAAHLRARAHESRWSPADVTEFLKRQNTRPPLWLRLNFPERAEEVRKELEGEAFSLRVTGEALEATGLKGIFATEGYRKGLFEIQDLASQRIGGQVQCAPGQLVWDCCAGGGGKTLQIAARLKNKGAVYASDVREYKLEEVKKRVRRAGFFNIRTLPWDGLHALPEFSKEVLNRGGFDWVLVDAPCTSTGTWRRNPDAKFRVEQRNIDNLIDLQLRLLSGASRAVRTRGRLVYSTCSWIVDENEGLVRAFLAAHPQFTLVSMALHGSPSEDSDTMFAAVFEKV